MMPGRASTSCERLPPPSCMSAMAPLKACVSTMFVMAEAPGSFQSSVSMFHSTLQLIRSAERAHSTSVKAP